MGLNFSYGFGGNLSQMTNGECRLAIASAFVLNHGDNLNE